MLEAKRYTLSELKEALFKESNDSKPLVGKTVIKDNAKNNVKAVRDIMKQAEDYNDVPKKKRRTNSELENDLNKTTLDVEFAYEPSQDYKDRIESQAKGFSSVSDEKNSSAKDNDSLYFDGNEKFFDSLKKRSYKKNDFKSTLKHAGLKTHNLPKETTKIKSPFNENKIMKRLHFKNTIFLNEENAKKRIPEDYKIDNNKFYIKDSIGNEYLVECTKDSVVDYIHTDVKLVKASPKVVNEELSRIKELTSYSSSKYLGESSKTPNSDFLKDMKIVNKLTEDTK